MQIVSIAELKKRFSAYLHKVRQGEEIIIRDHKRLIAKIAPLAPVDYTAEELELIATGQMRPAERPLPADFWEMPAPKISLEDIQTAIAADREDR